MSEFHTIDQRHAAARIARGELHLLDVRTPHEYAELGHIPGAWLLPVDRIASAPAVLPHDGRPVLVYCEHGVRSAHAASLLSRAGVLDVLNLSGGMSVWIGAREFGTGQVRGPSDWLMSNADLLPRGGLVLDVACGRGRHALLLASAGFHVHAADRDARVLEALAGTAARLGVRLETRDTDLESAEVDLGRDRYDAVIVFRFLHRPLMPTLARALKPGGVLFYETFTTAGASRHGPTCREFLLEPGELLQLVEPLRVERSREAQVDGIFLASIVARKVAAVEGGS